MAHFRPVRKLVDGDAWWKFVESDCRAIFGVFHGVFVGELQFDGELRCCSWWFDGNWWMDG